jgi:hypothetical protein
MRSLPSIRATDRDREDTLEVLRAAFAAGCLDIRELTERAGRAYGARTREELHSVVRDLPSGLDQAERTRPGPARWTRLRLLGWEYGLMLAVAGIWLFIALLPGVAAVPAILLLLVALRALGWLPRLAARYPRGSRRQEN